MADKIAELRANLTALRAEKTPENGNELSKHGSGSGSTRADDLKVRRVLKGHFGKVYAIHWAGENDDSKLVSASQDGKLIVWNASTMNKTMAIPLRSSWVMTCSFERETNGLVACGGLDNLCSIYNVGETEGTQGKASSELAHHDGYLSCCRFINQKEILTSSGDSSCILWDIVACTPKSHFQKHTSDVMSIARSPNDPNIFVSGSCDATCILWDTRLNESQPVWTFTGHESDINSVAFFPNGGAFGTGSDDSSCRIFEMRSMVQMRQFEADAILCGVTSVAFTSSGRHLCAGYDDYSLIVWDSLKDLSAQEMKDAKKSQHENRVSCVGVQSKGMAIATGSWDTILKVWA